MRISTQQLFQGGLGAILDAQEAAAETQLRLGSGQRLLNAADDPVASAATLGLQESLSQNDQHQKNIGFARARQVEEELSIGAAITSLQRVRELAVASNDAVLGSAERGFIAAEVRQRLTELVAIANTRDAGGEHIFSGFQSRTIPFALNPGGGITYSGDEGTRSIAIGSSSRVQIGDSGHAVFRTIRNGNGTFAVAPNAANTGTGVIDPGAVTDATAYDGDTYSVVMTERTGVTGGAIALTDAGANDTLGYELRINGTLVDSLGEGDTRTLTALETAINAQLGTTGVRAYVDGGALHLANTAPGGGNITVTETLTGATDAADALTGYFGANLNGPGSTSRDTVFGPAATGYVVIDSTANIETSGTFADNVAIAWNGIRTSITTSPDNGDTFSVSPSVNRDVFTTVEDFANALDNNAGGAFTNAVSNFLTDIDQAMEHLDGIRATVGGRLNVLDSQEDLNADFALQLKDSISGLRDLDYAQAASDLNLQLTALQAAQQSFLRVQNLSLFSLL